tara:strand:+ start:4396 stop:5067 length:672 start_codon:yes stop_codon:yes gene_type:complete
MTTSPRLLFDLLEEGATGLELEANDAFLLLDGAAGIGFEVIDRDLTSPPGSPSLGDAYICGSSSSGAWSGQDGKLALWNGNNWLFVAPYTGLSVYVKDEKFIIVYDEVGADWYALQDVWSATEIWTGLYRSGSKVFTKTVDFGALPSSAGAKNVAHGISNLDLNYLKAPYWKVIISSPTLGNATGVQSVGSINLITTTNVSMTVGGDFSAYSALWRLEYCKTS